MNDTKLIEACLRDSTAEEIEMLIMDGANVDAIGQDGCSPIHNAAAQGNFGAIRTLIKHGANVAGRSPYGNTALHFSGWQEGNEAVVVSLIDAGADLHARSKIGDTPLMGAKGEMKQFILKTAMMRQSMEGMGK